MRRSLIITTILAATAALGACTASPANNGGPNVNVKPLASPTVTASPVASPLASPSASPAASPGKDVKVNGKVETPKTTPTVEKKPVETPKK
jgi:hypothetical protein